MKEPASFFKTDINRESLSGASCAGRENGDLKVMKKETIAAISTGMTNSGIGIVRISGEEAFSIADRVYRGKDRISCVKSHTIHYGHITDGEETVDEVLVMAMRSPHTFTGEDTVEINCHGGTFVVKRVLEAVLKNGARPAEPGEFTKRAFLNGKINLSQAESVMELISAQGKEALRAANAQLSGALSKQISSVKEELLKLAAHLSAWVDYPEEEIPEVDEDEILSSTENALMKLEHLLSQFDTGKLIREGIDTVIVGKPNVGKSTLMNLLSRCERSIVTDIAGTTRDIVEETVRLGDLILRVSDTAGIRETTDTVEQIGISLAKQRMEQAALVLAVFDGSTKWSSEDEMILSAGEQTSVAVINKSDLPMITDAERIAQVFEHVVVLSANDPSSLNVLEREIRLALNLSGVDPFAPMLLNERQRICTQRAASSLKQVICEVKNGMTFDAVTVLIEDAIDALMEITGEKVTDAVVDSVFSNFCVGK